MISYRLVLVAPAFFMDRRPSFDEVSRRMGTTRPRHARGYDTE